MRVPVCLLALSTGCSYPAFGFVPNDATEPDTTTDSGVTADTGEGEDAVLDSSPEVIDGDVTDGAPEADAPDACPAGQRLCDMT